MPELWLNAQFARHWHGQDVFTAAARQTGAVMRELEQRRTLAFELAGRRYFIKRHHGVALREILKNLLTGRLPVVGARNEFIALGRLQSLGVPVPQPAAYGNRGWLPGTFESFLVTEDVGPHQSLEELCLQWPTHPPSFAEKRALILEVATIARTMHAGGICHRDFYLCHFLRREKDGRLVLIDLHRALCKRHLGKRWVVKDLGGLYFSAMDCGLTGRDVLRFLRSYRQGSLRAILGSEAGFWHSVATRALKLYGKHRQDGTRGEDQSMSTPSA